MKRHHLMDKLLVGVLVFLAMTQAYAGAPLWTFTPLTATSLTVPANATATVQYQITNQSSKPHTLVMTPIPGITQVTTAGNCPAQFTLAYQQSCILNLIVTGSALSDQVVNGPKVCQQNNPLQCYQPSAANSLNITKEAAEYSVGGSVFGLQGTLILENNGGDTLTLNADGTFAFTNPLSSGNTYSVTVQSQPATQICTVSNQSGTISNTNITNVTVNCSINAYNVGGSLSGLASSESVLLQNNGTDGLTLNADGTFTFVTAVAEGAPYAVTVVTQPSTQTCTVTNGNGTMGSSNINTVAVNCSFNAYTVGVTVSGLAASESVMLQNNGGDDLSANANSSFNFSTSVAEGSPYNVTVLTQPTTQICSVTNGSGIMGAANVTNVGVTCVTNTTTLSVSVSNLALSVTGLTEYGVSGTPSSGVARMMTITNTGGFSADNFSINYPTWPIGTTASSTCGSTLAVSGSCTITITPGGTATSDGTGPCSIGTAPIPGSIAINADNAGSLVTNVVVLDYGCIYQGGYVYALDETTPDTLSVGGKVAATTDQAAAFPNGIIWSSNSSGSYDGGISIYGISESSTTSSPSPSSGQVSGQVACNGGTDGPCDTNNIVTYYSPPTTSPGINDLFYAAGLCKQTISGFSDWYMPAICEMGYGSFCGSSSAPTLQNIQSNLVDYNGLNLLAGHYWSASEFSGAAQTIAWVERFAPSGSSFQSANDKLQPFGVRCSRALT